MTREQMINQAMAIAGVLDTEIDPDLMLQLSNGDLPEEISMDEMKLLDLEDGFYTATLGSTVRLRLLETDGSSKSWKKLLEIPKGKVKIAISSASIKVKKHVISTRVIFIYKRDGSRAMLKLSLDMAKVLCCNILSIEPRVGNLIDFATFRSPNNTCLEWNNEEGYRAVVLAHGGEDYGLDDH